MENLTYEEKMYLLRLRTLLQGIKAEIKGMRLTSKTPKSCSQMARELLASENEDIEFYQKLPRSRKKLAVILEDYINEYLEMNGIY